MALVGASGSAGSTLMNILAGLDVPTAGAGRVAGRDLLPTDAKARLRHRREWWASSTSRPPMEQRVPLEMETDHIAVRPDDAP